MEGPSRRKIVSNAKVDFNNIGSRSRPVSPFRPPPAETSTVIRPKAKVNSSATPLGRKSTTASSVVSSAPRARPTSPARPTHGNGPRPGPSHSVVDGPVSKPKSALSPHVLSRQRSLTSADGPFTKRTQRTDSGTLHPQDIPSIFSPDPSDPTKRPSTPTTASTPNVVRVKARVSGLATKAPLSVPSSPSSHSSFSAVPPYATTRSPQHRPRAPSITSALSIKVPPSSPPSVASAASGAPWGPITTAAPAANPHRYAPSQPVAHRYNPLAYGKDANHSNDRDAQYVHVTPKVDPAAIPLPPLSPPTSSVSFSSRSSHSSLSQGTQSSLSRSTAPTLNSHVNGMVLGDREQEGAPRGTSTLDLLVGFMSGDESDTRSASAPTSQRPANDAGSKVRAEAKSNRKIEDLEITNRSLLVINSSLEATKHKQAKEIRDLRRKLRESRLILPPKAYRAVKSSLSPAEAADDEEEEAEEGDDEEEGDEESFSKQDETYRRVKSMLDGLIESGKKALEAKPDDFREGGKGGKVLNPVELQSWSEDVVDDARSTNADSAASSRPLTPSRIATPLDEEDDVDSNSEGEAGSMDDDDIPSALLPPIMVTSS